MAVSSFTINDLPDDCFFEIFDKIPRVLDKIKLKRGKTDWPTN